MTTSNSNTAEASTSDQGSWATDPTNRQWVDAGWTMEEVVRFQALGAFDQDRVDECVKYLGSSRGEALEWLAALLAIFAANPEYHSVPEQSGNWLASLIDGWRDVVAGPTEVVEWGRLGFEDDNLYDLGYDQPAADRWLTAADADAWWTAVGVTRETRYAWASSDLGFEDVVRCNRDAVASIPADYENKYFAMQEWARMAHDRMEEGKGTDRETMAVLVNEYLVDFGCDGYRPTSL